MESNSVQLDDVQAGASTSTVSANASSKHIVRNAIIGYVASAVAMGLGFVVTPVLVRCLGSDQFGLWALMTSVIGYTGLIELGVGTATAKRVAECRATGDVDRLERLLGTAIVMYSAMALLVLLATAALYTLLPHIFMLPADQLGPARKCLLLLGVSQASAFLFVVQTAILFGSGRLDLATGSGIAFNLLSSLVNVGLVLAGFGVPSLAACTVLTTICNGLAARGLIRRNDLGARVRPSKASWGMARELLKYGSRNAFVAVCGTLAYGADSLVIGILLPVSNVAHYAIAAKLVNLLRSLATKPIDVLMPAYAHSYSVGDKQRLFRLFTGSTVAGLMIAMPLVICVLTFGDVLIRVWVGPGHEASYGIAACLGLALLLQLPGHASFTIFTGTERYRYLALVSGLSAPLNLVLSVLLTRRFGPIGVALGSLITVAVGDMVVLPVAVCKEFGFDGRRYCRRILEPIAAPALLAAVIGVAIRFLGLTVSLPVALAGAAAVFVSFWCARLFSTRDVPTKPSWPERLRMLVPRGS